MARTKQRSRLPRNPRIPKDPPSHPKREYAFKEERNRLLKRKLNQVHSDHHHPNALALTSLCDLEILTLDNSAETRVIISENHNDDMMIASSTTSVKSRELFQWLHLKLSSHKCTAACFRHIPKIDFENIIGTILENPTKVIETGRTEKNIYSVCDEACDEEDRQMAFDILKEFEQDCEQFDLVERSLKSTSNNPYGFGTSCEYHFYEYRYCGKVCYYLREEQFDMCLLLMNRDEFLYLGQQGAHAFYGLPHFSYVNSDGSSPNVYEEWKDNFSFDDENQVLELGKLLSQVHEFLTGVTANDYH
ncbi:hypothetical protein C9374_006484 [Naegleria lovaniensis]|uniref:Uncharacterized protein n=1 Tax=Naegleria lovaniensis TaxID=51637 RepID=A0AA88GP53_NAELO|nr:uncharacterized protein C9374_006484 [Naegleria lovaniensis]KAG2381495.1 hypothetical protein C9374_006484 [Naegleria lovaniensis]